MRLNIKAAQASDAQHVAHGVLRLLGELAPEKSFNPKEMEDVAQRLLNDPDSFAAFLAYDQDECVGVITVTRCVAIYSKGEFGEIAELFVAPEYRGHKIGQALIAAATDYAHGRGWTRLEVGAPPVPEWSRSVAFYKANGFSEVGPRLKYTFEG